MKKYVNEFYGKYPIASGYLPKIINQKHLDRLSRLLEGENVLLGGYVSQGKCMIEPTLLEGISWDSPVMQEEIVSRLPFGGGCINDTIIHIANPKLPFGGIGGSGMGQYHGRYSLETFSHKKAVVRKYNYIDIFLRYPPFKNHLSLLKWLI